MPKRFNEKTEEFYSLSATGEEGIAVFGEDYAPRFSVSEQDTLYFVTQERKVCVAKHDSFIKYTYKLADEEIALYEPSVPIIVALVNKTMPHKLWKLRQNSDCSSKSIRSKNCSHVCVIREESQGNCLCPHGYLLGDDNATCVVVEVKKILCNDDQFKCNDTRCIQSKLLCDGVPDCNTGEDEANCRNQVKCPKNTFHCGKNGEPGKCIPNKWLCDGEKDCATGSDEKSCVEFTCTGKY